MNKYGNKKCIYNGIVFDSRKECNRYVELTLMARSGIISDLKLQKEFVLIPAQYKDGKCVERACKYKADFYYFDNEKQCYICEDVKGFRTDVYKIKKKLMLYVHDIEVIEI